MQKLHIPNLDGIPGSAEFTAREVDGCFQILLDGVPVDIGEPIECAVEAEAFLRAANSVPVSVEVAS